ncbi:hypothetical protein FA13DRAFT_1726422 [Coprinellus micaceus]|uniref:Uncharacterized protein n=1 Tax=Coprinellus micaceus TaxID=71717 RepID=A0A4Y7TT61_COPMI|nr:hypothetical protein FA13DRAFT_1726422 [Coprinellus micaceus]
MFSSLTSWFPGRGNGAPDPSSSHDQTQTPPSRRPYTRDSDDDGDDNRSIGSDLPPSDDDDDGNRTRPYVPPWRDGARSHRHGTGGGRVREPSRNTRAPSRRHDQGPLVQAVLRIPPPPMAPMCIVCNVRPAFVHPATGKQYPTCGTTCGDKLSSFCEICFAKPRNGTYTTCGMTCAKELKTQKASCIQCKARPKLVGGNGKGYLYCGKTCRDAARAGVPPAAPKSKRAQKPSIFQGPNPGAARTSATPARGAF